MEIVRVILKIFLVILAVYGSYMALASLGNWSKFIDSPKRVDLIKLFGNFGRVLYFILGIISATVGIVFLLKL